MIKVIKHITMCTAFQFFSVFLRFLFNVEIWEVWFWLIDLFFLVAVFLLQISTSR